MYEWIVFVLTVALLLYLILAGADFGAGILELFTNRDERASVEALTYQAIGPVWEANHIWLILIIVILFNAFPDIYAVVSTYLHLPLMLMLIGIVFRGTAFAFRHYDAVKDRSQRLYSSAFSMASLLTPLFLGAIAGATILGRIQSNPTNFADGYLWPWVNSFCLSVGLLTASICAWLAATFLIGEAEEGSALQQKFTRQSKLALGATIFLGAIVFIGGEWSGISLFSMFLDSPLSIAGVWLASLGLIVYHQALLRKRWQLLRLIAGGQAATIVLSWIIAQYPVAINLQNSADLTLAGSKAPEVVLDVLGMSLLFGVALIFPALYFLIRTFKYSANSS